MVAGTHASVRARSVGATGHRGSDGTEQRNTMGEKSARKNTPKTAASKTLKEKRLDKQTKKASNERSNNTDAVTRAANK
jgi:hypothetical protein